MRTLEPIDARTAQLQGQLWSIVQTTAAKQPTGAMALAESGMNDVLNSQGYTQAAWSNRIPIEAWGLMFVLAIFSNLLVGYTCASQGRSYVLNIAAGIVHNVLSHSRHQ